jgi:NAD(P)-dependent dehydrogenase (short-subunit alcohol dehydrogenase family)
VTARKKSSPSSLRNQVALITGATRGIGLAVARALAEAGCRLVITGRDPAALKRAARELGKPTLAVSCDVRDPLSVQQLCIAAEGRFHRIDILINNAGIAHAMQNVDTLDLQTWSDVLATNLTGMFLLTHYALPLIPAGGIIVNNLSIAAKRVFTGQSAYIASKHGALGFTNALREELRPRRIRVIGLLPGATDTEVWNDLWPDAPRKKMISPQAVADLLLAALKTPPQGTVEELVILPTAGTL